MGRHIGIVKADDAQIIRNGEAKFLRFDDRPGRDVVVGADDGGGMWSGSLQYVAHSVPAAGNEAAVGAHEVLWADGDTGAGGEGCGRNRADRRNRGKDRINALRCGRVRRPNRWDGAASSPALMASGEPPGSPVRPTEASSRWAARPRRAGAGTAGNAGAGGVVGKTGNGAGVAATGMTSGPSGGGTIGGSGTSGTAGIAESVADASATGSWAAAATWPRASPSGRWS